jgi:predicted transcriptional regulator
MTIGRICQKQLDTAEPDESARAAAQRMATRRVGALLVLDVHRKPIGIPPTATSRSASAARAATATGPRSAR